MFDNFEGRVIIVDGTDIAFVIGGSGPPLLMLHGFPQNKTMWARVAPLLTDHFTVVCADLRGYGDSAKPVCLPDRSNYSFRALADDQVGLMRKLGFERFHVVGHDRGGRTGHRMALDYPDYFYETCLFGWGTAKVSDFDTEMLADYRRAWRDPAMIHGSCADYRAAASIDLDHDRADIDQKVRCPTLVLFGASGTMAALFDIPAEWRKRCLDVNEASLPGGHFFVDQHPDATARQLLGFLTHHLSDG